MALDARGSLAVAPLAALVGRDHTTVSRQLAKLAGLKLIRRRDGASDRRETAAELTAAGSEIAHKIALARRRLMAKALADWSEARLPGARKSQPPLCRYIACADPRGRRVGLNSPCRALSCRAPSLGDFVDEETESQEPRPHDAPKGRPPLVVGVYRRARRPDRSHMEALSKRVPYWFLVASLLAFASFQIWMNPFGFSDLVQRYSQDVADLLITGPYFYGTEGRDQVSVAIIDEDTLHTLQAPWPWKYGDHAARAGRAAAIPSQGGGGRHPVRSIPDPTTRCPTWSPRSAATRRRTSRSISRAGSICPSARTRCGRRSRRAACRCWIRPCRSTTAWRASTTRPDSASATSPMTTEPVHRSPCMSSRMSIRRCRSRN